MKHFNIFSNYIYLVVGLVVAFLSMSPQALIFLAAMGALSIGSALYHAQPKKWPDLDVAAMYALGAVVSTWQLLGLTLLDSGATAAIMLGLGVAAAYFFRFTKGLPKWLTMEKKVGLLFLPAFVVLSIIDLRMAALAVALFAVAYGARQSEKAWGHGVWHIVAAVMVGVLVI